MLLSDRRFRNAILYVTLHTAGLNRLPHRALRRARLCAYVLVLHCCLNSQMSSPPIVYTTIFRSLEWGISLTWSLLCWLEWDVV